MDCVSELEATNKLNGKNSADSFNEIDIKDTPNNKKLFDIKQEKK